MKKSILSISLVCIAFSLSCVLTSCSSSGGGEDISFTDYSVAESQLKEDYGDNVGEISWSSKRGYQIGNFSLTTNTTSIRLQSQFQTVTAWYTVSEDTATREMDSKDLGTAVPDKIKDAFEATKYSDTALWIITEIELESDYTGNSFTKYYEMELRNVDNQDLEAELLFNFTTGILLHTKEELDEGDEDDNFVVNTDLKAAVEAAVPGAQIIDAEIEVDNNNNAIIEVDAIITVDAITRELELKFTMTYELISSETETEYSYGTLPSKYDAVNDWLVINSGIAPIPPDDTKVEITEGEQSETDYNIGNYYYEIEIDDYFDNSTEYEVEFYLDRNYALIAVIVNDVKQNQL